MPIEPLPDLPPTQEGVDSVDTSDPGSDPKAGVSPESPLELSEFSQRLASFGLGEVPDPLLTEARPPTQRRSRT